MTDTPQKKKHILVVSQYFYPEAFRINDMCAEWVRRGYKITVLTGIPNYPYGRYFDGYGLFKKRRESYMGMDIIRIPLIARGKSAVGMCLNYISFVVSGWFWKCFTALKADMVFIFEVSPMTQALAGVWYAQRRRIPCWIYVQDLWPENIEIVTGIHSPLVLRPIGRMVDSIYRRCDRIFATSPSFVRMIQQRVPGEEDKVSYWPQYAEEFYSPAQRPDARIPQDGRFRVIFTGNVGMAQGLDILPETAALLKASGTAAQFVIVGDGRGKTALEDKIKKLGAADMFLLIPRQRAEDIPALLAACDAAFVSFMNNPLFANTIPAMLQSYMACGMPVLACATGETERIVKEADCGVCSPIGDAAALAEAVRALMRDGRLEQYGINARKYFTAHYDKKMLLDRFDECVRAMDAAERGKNV